MKVHIILKAPLKVNIKKAVWRVVFSPGSTSRSYRVKNLPMRGYNNVTV